MYPELTGETNKLKIKEVYCSCCVITGSCDEVKLHVLVPYVVIVIFLNDWVKFYCENKSNLCYKRYRLHIYSSRSILNITTFHRNEGLL